MYTVARLISKTVGRDGLNRIGALVNKRAPGTFLGVDKVGDRFSVSVHSNGSWSDHRAAIIEFIQEFKGVIQRAKAEDIRLEFDVAIEPEDYNSGIYLSIALDTDFLRALVRREVGLMLTYYVGVRKTTEPSRTQKSKGK